MQPLSGNQRPGLLTSLMNMSFVLRLPREMFLQILVFKCRTLAIVFGNATKPSRFAHFWEGARTIPCACQNGIWNGIWTSKSGPNPVFLTFWLRNVLLAITACTFSTSQLPKVVRTWCVSYILTSKCASRHNGVHFFISHLARWLRTRRFSKPTFRPSGATNDWKNTVFRDFPTFSRTCIFFLLTLSLLWSSLFYSSFLWLFPSLFFYLSILSEVWLLNFLR